MLIIQDKLISLDLLEEHFLCNLEACKGACCWEGDGGAPLEEAELSILADIYNTIKPYLSPAGIKAIEEQGTTTFDKEFQEYATPLIDKGPCAYMIFDEKGCAKCGIEKAFEEGLIDFKKPISCHLYPIRVVKNKEKNFEALNYHRWSICSAACENGKKHQLPIYQFAKVAIIRKYGVHFYEELDAAAKNHPF